MIGTERATLPRPHGHRQPRDTPLPEAFALAEFEAEFFVDWQVADDLVMTPGDSATEK